jgi:hypothetical protein
MRRHWLTLLIGVGFVLALTGCNRNQEIQAELFRIRDRNKAEMDLLKKSNELLNRRYNDLKERVDKLQETNDRLTGELTEYATRPEEVKLEIITEVNTRFAAIANGQQDFMTQVNADFEEKEAVIETDLVAGLDRMEKTLLQHAAFVQFVSSEQDSINRVFAGRFDSRPWYQSVLGKWADMERGKLEEAP